MCKRSLVTQYLFYLGVVSVRNYGNEKELGKELINFSLKFIMGKKVIGFCLKILKLMITFHSFGMNISIQLYFFKQSNENFITGIGTMIFFWFYNLNLRIFSIHFHITFDR